MALTRRSGWHRLMLTTARATLGLALLASAAALPSVAVAACTAFGGVCHNFGTDSCCSGLECNDIVVTVSPPSQNGVCHLTLGAGPCTGAADCVSGQCDLANQVCVPNTTEGSQCLEGDPDCGVGPNGQMYCAGAKCVYPHGDSCTANNQCISEDCSTFVCTTSAVNTYCDTSSDCAAPGKCMRHECRYPSGATCTVSAECASNNCAGGTTCACSGVAPGAAGGCATNADCCAGSGAICSFGVCSLPTGSTCLTNQKCVVGTCAGGVCPKATYASGPDSCLSNSDCQTGYTCETSTGQCVLEVGSTVNCVTNNDECTSQSCGSSGYCVCNGLTPDAGYGICLTAADCCSPNTGQSYDYACYLGHCLMSDYNPGWSGYQGACTGGSDCPYCKRNSDCISDNCYVSAGLCIPSGAGQRCMDTTTCANPYVCYDAGPVAPLECFLPSFSPCSVAFDCYSGVCSSGQCL
jgi:hypothetical protein